MRNETMKIYIYIFILEFIIHKSKLIQISLHKIYFRPIPKITKNSFNTHDFDKFNIFMSFVCNCRVIAGEILAEQKDAILRKYI